MPTKNANLSDEQSKFVRQSIKTGRYRNTSEVVRAGLSLLEQRAREEKSKLDTLRRLAAEGFAEIDRGEYETVHPEELDDYMSRLEAKSRYQDD